jgi:uncharacterized protein (TIGR03083 family)
MDRDAYLEHLASDGARVAAIAREHLDATVPTCPGWTVRDLVEHLGMVHRWQTEAARVDAGSFPDMSSAALAPADGASWGDWLQEGVDAAIATMSTLDPDAPRWTWTKPNGGDTAQWYFRRIAQETLVHRIDAELAVGEVTAVDPVFAVDGVDEMCDVLLPLAKGQQIDGGGTTVHLHATDAEGEWLLTMHDDHVDVARGHAKGDAAIRGTARDLLLEVWGRAPIGEVEVFGDESVVATFRRGARL